MSSGICDIARCLFQLRDTGAHLWRRWLPPDLPRGDVSR
jgi:hypothetical protein